MTKKDESGVLDLSDFDAKEAKLVGFRVNSADLHLLHKIWLDDNVIPILVSGGGAVVVGYASRTGSPLHNLNLSTERANSVGKYLRFRAAGRGLVSVPAVMVNASLGESAAAAAGVKDGTEDVFYRAVHLKAWSKPTPPPPPPPKPPAPNKQVVIFRRWQKSSVNQPSEPGSLGGDLGGAGKDALWPDYGESRHRSFPSDYAVNGVRDELTID